MSFAGTSEAIQVPWFSSFCICVHLPTRALSKAIPASSLPASLSSVLPPFSHQFRLLFQQLSHFPLNTSSYIPVKVVIVCLLDKPNKIKQNNTKTKAKSHPTSPQTEDLTVSAAPFSQLPLETLIPSVYLVLVPLTVSQHTEHLYSHRQHIGLVP